MFSKLEHVESLRVIARIPCTVAAQTVAISSDLDFARMLFTTFFAAASHPIVYYHTKSTRQLSRFNFSNAIMFPVRCRQGIDPAHARSH